MSPSNISFIYISSVLVSTQGYTELDYIKVAQSLAVLRTKGSTQGYTELDYIKVAQCLAVLRTKGKQGARGNQPAGIGRNQGTRG